MKRTVWIIAGVVVLALLLGGAAFVGGRLLVDPGPSRDAQPVVEMIPGSTEGEVTTTQIEMEMAEGLPKTAPDVFGIFQERQDKSIFVGTGDMTTSVAENEDGTVDFQLTHSGPKVEAVVTAKTQVYKDVTEMNFDQPSASVQQKVEPGTLDEIGDDSMVMVWGKRTGDRVVAEVLLYSPPQVMIMPGPAP